MAYYFSEPSRTFGEYLLVPGYSSSANVPNAVSLRTPLVKFRKGQEECPLEMNIPMVSAIMQSVSGEKLAIALAKQGGVSFIYGSQTIEQEADMVRRVKAYKKGFVTSDSNLPPEATLADVLDLKARTGHSTVAITADGTAHGKLLGIVASRDYRLSRMATDLKVTEFMTPLDKLVTAPATTSLHDCNDIIWDNKINSLPLIDEEGNLQYMVFRKDYDSHKENVNELLDANKSYVVGAGINTRDYAERVPALVDAGVDVLCIDSSEGFSEWQSRTISWIRERYGDKVKVGAGNVVDRDGFLFLAKAGAALLTDQFVFRWEAADWMFAFVFATAVSFIAVLGFQIGVKYTGGQTSAILSTFEPITSVIVGIIAYGESFSARGVIGCVLILTATVIIACLKEDVKEQPEISEDTAA